MLCSSDSVSSVFMCVFTLCTFSHVKSVVLKEENTYLRVAIGVAVVTGVSFLLYRLIRRTS